VRADPRLKNYFYFADDALGGMDVITMKKANPAAK
jgi:hypothetical protein